MATRRKKAVFPYQRWNGLYLPMVPVLIRGLHTHVDALVDSGARTSVFRSEIAEALKIHLRRGRREKVEGFGGVITTYQHELDVEVADFKFPCKISFCHGADIQFNVLGRDNFFEKFLITFDERRKRVTLSSSPLL